MIQNANITHPILHKSKPGNNTLMYSHGGDTWGYLSNQGFFPNMNFSISVISDADIDPLIPFLV
jgi:hypothetical protein